MQQHWNFAVHTRISKHVSVDETLATTVAETSLCNPSADHS